MKKILFIFLILSTLVVISCRRGANGYVGDFSYKLSGEVEIINSDGTSEFHLIHKNGQLNIYKERGKNELLLTFNEMNGPCYTVVADFANDSIALRPYTFSTNILSSSGIPLPNSGNEISLVYTIMSRGGTGVLKGEELLLIDEFWDGHLSGDSSTTINGASIKTTAERN